MDESREGRPVKIKFSDKRRAGRDRDPAPSGTSSSGSPLRSATEETAGTAGSSSASRPQTTEPSSPGPSSTGATQEDDSKENREVSQTDVDASSLLEEEKEEQNQVKVEAEKRPDYLEDLRRVQADFDNYRKRVLREQTQLASRASARLIERLLPVLDNFEAAISHGEGGNGVELVYKELRRVLEEEGLEEIPAEGEPFDPRLHEAFQAVEDDGVDEPVVRSVLRRGYVLKGQVLRASMVSVARPPDGAAQEDKSDDSTDADAAEG